MLALMLAAALPPVDYFPDAGSGPALSSIHPPPSHPDPARALLEDPSPQNARAFLEWQRREEERLRAALEALDSERRRREPAPRRPVRGDLLAPYRRGS